MSGDTGDHVYDVAVVGAGMIGSAAARHLTETPGRRVVQIGPAENQDRSCQKSNIFGAHYDEGRVTRVLDPDPVWALLAKKSISRYREIEKRSGIQFYSEVGFLSVGPKHGKYIDNVKKIARTLHANVDVYDAEEIKRVFPYLQFERYNECVLSKNNSGHISPRKLVAAQKAIARANGCTIIDDVVCRLDVVTEPRRHVVLTTDNAVTVRATRVLLAVGAFTMNRALIPAQLTPALTHLSQTVVKCRISEDQAKHYAHMPCIIVKEAIENPSSETGYSDSSKNYGCYILPPIQYPDGHYYVKIGHGDQDARVLRESVDVERWYRTRGDVTIADHISAMLSRYLPDLQILATEMDNCVTAHTPSDRPYIDMISADVGVALGGCGYAAKSSDELGRMAALMISNDNWVYEELPAELFRFQKLHPDRRKHSARL